MRLSRLGHRDACFLRLHRILCGLQILDLLSPSKCVKIVTILVVEHYDAVRRRQRTAWSHSRRQQD